MGQKRNTRGGNKVVTPKGSDADESQESQAKFSEGKICAKSQQRSPLPKKPKLVENKQNRDKDNDKESEKVPGVQDNTFETVVEIHEGIEHNDEIGPETQDRSKTRSAEKVKFSDSVDPENVVKAKVKRSLMPKEKQIKQKKLKKSSNKRKKFGRYGDTSESGSSSESSSDESVGSYQLNMEHSDQFSSGS